MKSNDFEIKLRAVIGKVGKKELSVRMSISRGTLYRKIKSPENWKLHEVEKVESIYNECFK